MKINKSNMFLKNIFEMDKLNSFSKPNTDLVSLINIAKKNKIVNPVPCSCAFNEEEYWKYAYKFKKELLRHLKESYIVLTHKHNDIYVHETKYETVDKILSDGFLIGSGEDNALGKGVYTFPLKCGRISTLRKDSYYIVFSSNEEHCHIVGTDDGNHELGEADFLVDKLSITNPKVYSVNEMMNISRNNFECKNVLKDYYGLLNNHLVTYDNLCEIVSKYN